MAKVKIPEIPEQLVVVSQKRMVDRDPAGNHTFMKLGFLNGFLPEKKDFDKTLRTMSIWAYGSTVRLDLYEGKLRTTQYTHVAGDPYRTWVPTHDVPTCLTDNPVQIWENMPMTGFRVSGFTSRHRGNKLWYVEDPRGITFEVKTAAFEDLILSTTLVKGEIMAPCIWKSNQNLVLA